MPHSAQSTGPAGTISPQDRLLAAVRDGDARRVAAILDVEPHAFDARNDAATSPLLAACELQRTDLIELFLRRQPLLDIFEAAALNLGSRVTELLDRDAGLVRSISHDGLTPLHVAARFGSDGAARRLLRRRADPIAVARDGSGAQPLHHAAAHGHAAVVSLLLAAGAKPDARQADGRSARELAADAATRKAFGTAR